MDSCIIIVRSEKSNHANVVCVWIHAMSYDEQKWYSIPHTLSWFDIRKVIRIEDNLEYNTTIPMIVGSA